MKQILPLCGILSVFLTVGASARFTMAGDYDNMCREIPTPGDHIGSYCRCMGYGESVAPVASCRKETWDGISMCTGYEAGTPCNGGGVLPPSGEYELKIPVEIQDSIFVDLHHIEGGDTGVARDYSAAYEIHHLYDSCRVIYTFAELWQGEERLELDNWGFHQYVKDKTDAELSDLCKSRPFTVSGDPISYYRDISWFDHRPGHRDQLVNNFYCPDTLTYTVSFVNVTTQQRIEVQHLVVTGNGSGHIMTSGGLPIAVVTWTPPTSWNGMSAYVDVDVSVTGPGIFNPAKWGSIVGNLWKNLEEPFYSGYYKQFNQPYPIGGELE